MQQLTMLEYSLLQKIKTGTYPATWFGSEDSLKQKGLIKEVDGRLVIIPGASYNYRGNTYKL